MPISAVFSVEYSASPWSGCSVANEARLTMLPPRPAISLAAAADRYQFRRDPFAVGLLAAADDHVHAGAGQHARGRLADAYRRAGDQRDLGPSG